MVRPFEIVRLGQQGRNDLTPRIRFGPVERYIPEQDRWKSVTNGRFGFAFSYPIVWVRRTQQVVTAIYPASHNRRHIVHRIRSARSCSGWKLQVIVGVPMEGSTAQTTSAGTEENQLPTERDRDARASSKVLTVERKWPGSKSSSDFLGRSPKMPGSRADRPRIPHKSKSRIKWQESCYSSAMEAPLMPEPITSPLCFICHTPVELEISKTDENGRAVHERCYLLRLRQKQRTTESNPSRQYDGLKNYREFSGISFRARRSTMIG